MIEIGKVLPNLTGPTETTGAASTFAFKGFSFVLSADHAGTRPQDQPRLTPKYQGCARGYCTAENAVGTRSCLTMLSMIWPSCSLLARPACQSGSVGSAVHV